MSENYTALYEQHKKAGASFTDFGGWQMPLKYESELAEHHAVRNAAGLFDLSHRGEVWVTGPQAAAFLDYALVGKLSAVAEGRAKYSLICDADGGIIDDLITYRRSEDKFLVVPNAGNAAVVAAALLERAAGFDVVVEDASAETSLVAVQGPNAEAILLKLVPAEQHSLVTELKYYAAVEVSIAGDELLLARTGYTGEDGFEIVVPADRVEALWQSLLDAGVKPAGLGARDTLRLEAGMNLYGQDMDESTTPYEAGLAWTVALDEGRAFTGRDVLEAQRGQGVPRQLVALVLEEKGVLRHGQKVTTANGDGEVLSGTFSPTLGKAIAFARVPAGDPGEVRVEIRGRALPVRVVKAPFVREGKALH